MRIDPIKEFTKYLVLIATAVLIPLSSALAQEDDNSLAQKDLPIKAIEKGEVVLAEGMGFQLAPFDPNRHFNPEEEMPTWSGTSIANNKIEWVPTPKDLTITDDLMLGVTGKGEDEFHGLRLIQYRERIQQPSNFYTVLGILSWDTVPFCIYRMERQEDNESGIYTDCDLIYDKGLVEVEVIQQESGTGAFNVRGIFSISGSQKPKLIKIASHSRGR
jgi:hypothetical protein